MISKVHIVMYRDPYRGCEECGHRDEAQIMAVFATSECADAYIKTGRPYGDAKDYSITTENLRVRGGK